MSDQIVTLELPKALWEWAERTATTTQRPVEKVLVDSLAATMLPPLDDVPDEFREELVQFETEKDKVKHVAPMGLWGDGSLSPFL